jgi:RHS repeat-associated protein
MNNLHKQAGNCDPHTAAEWCAAPHPTHRLVPMQPTLSHQAMHHSGIVGRRYPVRRLVPYLWIAVSVLGASAVQAQVPSDPYNYSRSSAFEYDPASGLLTSETVEPDNLAACVKTSYQYDAYGNRNTATTSNCAGASDRAVFPPRTSASTNAEQTVVVAGVSEVVVAKGSFPTLASNALGQAEQKTFDPRFGAVTSLTGPNQLATYWQVDDFGRTVKELRADGTSTITAYCYVPGKVADTSSGSPGCPVPAAGEAPADAVSFVHSEARNTDNVKNGPFSRVYLDRAGRKIRSVTEAFDGSTQPGGSGRLIVQDTDFNAQGAPVVSTQPYFLDTLASTSGASNSYGMSTTAYDALGRPVSIFVSDPQGSRSGVAFGARGIRQAALTSISYNGLVTITTNDKGQTRTEEKNADGKLVRVTDALGAQIAYQHDAFDNLIRSKDALQNIITIAHDIRGRKVGMSDPDSGNWQYDYNALGELVWQQSPNQRALSQATTMRYDTLGRMVQRVEPEYTSIWYYDRYADTSACSKGAGKLCETNTSNGVNRKIVYDSMGRPVATRTSIANGPSFATAVSYDSANGRLASQTYPTGLQVNYNYTPKGFLSAARLGTAATVTPLPAAPGGTPGAGTSLPAGSVLWLAEAYNAWGKAERLSYGNNVVSRAGFDAMTGRVVSTAAGSGMNDYVLNYSYAWDSLHHLSERADAIGDGTTGAVTDNFVYDGVGRLQSYTVRAPAIPGLERTVGLQYNALGSMLYKSDVGVYSYPAQGAAAVRPHALQRVAGALGASYQYDANGNLTSASAGSYRSVAYTSFNLPDSQTGLQGPDGAPKYSWQYDETHQRIKETRIDGSGTRTTWMLHPDNAGGLSFESEQNGGATSNRHYLSAGGVSIGVLVSSGDLPALPANGTAPPALSDINLSKVEYWHKDHLGSLAATTDHDGAVTARYSYDPFGKRRTASGNYDANGNLVVDWNNTNKGTDRGYTGHEHLDEVGVIHMNGRIYDPRLGIFMQVDPFIQDPTNLQNFNRYGYCYNNPMTCVDPTGHFFGIDDLIFAVVLVWAAEKANIINAGVARQVTGLIVTVALMQPSLTQTLGGGMMQASISGFAGGAISSGTVKGGLQGGVTAAAFFQAGELIGGRYTDGATLSTGEGIAVHGVVGCVTSALGGGKCGPGALSASFAKAMAPTMAGAGEKNILAGVIVSAVVGGTGSVLGGGKFANGAQTGAFSYLFNCIAHECFAQGRDAEATFRTYLTGNGRQQALRLGFNRWYDSDDNFFFGMPDIFSEQLRMVWDVKPDSLYGFSSGFEQITKYTLTGVYSPGLAQPLFGDQSTILLTGSMNRYEYRFGGRGLVIYHALDKSPMEKSIEQVLRSIGTQGPSVLPPARRPRDPFGL